ncbi:MAG: translocation/assembly module TamB domain-containing protein [Bryobacteraceae bacterium]|jgi:translocation and assembly module TamB
MRRSTKIVALSFLGLAVLGIALVVAGVVLVQTTWFKNLVRIRMVSVVERATGGRVEIGSFSYNWRDLTAEVAPFVLHGTEPPSAPPLFRADKIQIGLKIISALERKVDIASLIVESPHAYITLGPDGSTNIPRPKIPRFNQNVVEDLLDLHVQHIELRRGIADYNSWRVPLDAIGEHLQMSLVYQPAGPRYLCAISSGLMRVSSPKLRAPTEFALDSQVELGRNTIQVLRMNLASGGMKIEATGNIDNLYSPRLDFDVIAALPVQDLNRLVRTPLEPRGNLWLQGHVSASGSSSDRFIGKLTGRSLGYVHQGLGMHDIAMSSNADLTPDKINLTDLQLSAPDGTFRGVAQITELKRIAVKGQIDGVTIAEVGRLTARQTGALNGTFSGSLQLAGQVTPDGLAGVSASAMLDLKPKAGDGIPVQGSLAIDYDQRAGKLRLGNSQVDVGSTHAALSGTLGENLSVHVVSRNLSDALPVLRALGAQTPAQWPVELQDGVARIDAVVKGGLPDPKISGTAGADKLKLDGHQLDRVTSTFTLDRSNAVLQAITVDEGKMRLEGNGRAGLRDWKLEGTSPVSAAVSLRTADIQTLAAEAGWKAPPATGLVSAAVHVSGSLESPLVAGTVTLENLIVYDEHFGKARGDVTLTTTALELTHGEARNGAGRITLSGDYNHPASDWKDGSLRFDVATSGVDLSGIQHLQDVESGLGGRLDLKASGGAKIVNGVVDLTSLNGDLTVRNAALNGRAYGNLTVTAATKLPMLTLAATATLDDVQIHGSGEWRMEGDYRGEARVPIPRISFATLHDLTPGKHVRQDLPFDGFIEGDAIISGPLNQPSAMKADVTLSTVQLNASPNARLVSGVVLQDLVLRNAQPLHVVATTSSIDFGHASFIAKDTTLDATGRLALNSKNPWDVAIQGRINFSILQLFNPDLLGAGASIINVTIHGPLTEPQVEGRLELKNASLFLRDVPNGVDSANGLILFDRNRATVQELSGKSGGGDISFESGSFLGFRGAALVYRLQATARNVRYRSPEGISVTADGSLALVGTSESSVLSGSVSVTRAAFNPRTDVGALLASTTTPVAAAPNEYLQGVQLDVRVVTLHTLEVETSLTRNIQADTDLRVRGTPERPILLGHITVNSGQIEFFGNKYSINRGEISFNNPAKIEPVLNMDLSTTVRGITVDISFSGSLNKLNFSYRSDPPLEASDIVALLAVGRTPSTAGPLATSQATTNINNSYLGLGTGSNSLLSQAIAPNSGRLQKFFGVSHIKIDPQLTDVTIVPQARLTMEQQVSSDVTLTYITNLAVTNQQIVRVQWDFSRKWSAVALRDENGAFSIDFQYRKRFK